MSEMITPEPHMVPGYTGHCAQNRERVGRTYGHQTHKLLIDPCVNHSPELIVVPIHAKPDLKDYPTDGELQTLSDREAFVDAVYRYPIIPGYSGFVPNMFPQTGKRYVAAAVAGVAQHEQLMQRYRCDRHTLRHRDLLESGRGLFEHKQNERMLPQTVYRAPLIPVTGRGKGIKVDECPPLATEKLSYSKFTTPHFLDDDDKDKFIVGRYAGHVPMAITRFGEPSKDLTHNALCNFSSYMYKKQRDAWCCGQDLTTPAIKCPPVGQFVIYHKDHGMHPRYAGHVPGHLYKIGRTYEKTTYNAKQWLDLHKDLTILPEIANLDYEY